MFKRILAIGDIHGQYDKLVNLWEKIGYNDNEDFIVFLGDYIDRGSKSIECLRFVRDLIKSNNNVHALCGNHEAMFKEYFQENQLRYTNIYEDLVQTGNGGNVTLQQFQEHMVNNPNEMKQLIEFIFELDYVNTAIDGVLFVHAGVNPRICELGRQPINDLLWIRSDFFNNYSGDKLVVVGHTPVQIYTDGANKPLVLKNNIIMLDTGSFLPNGKVTCMDIRTKKYWQA
jgi:serine/threonine protein phosphatase